MIHSIAMADLEPSQQQQRRCMAIKPLEKCQMKKSSIEEKKLTILFPNMQEKKHRQCLHLPPQVTVNTAAASDTFYLQNL